MFAGLKKSVLQLAQNAAREVACPKCQHRFKPFADAPLESFAQLTQPLPCPKCGHTFRAEEGMKSASEQEVNPPGPFSKPAGSRIEMIPEDGAWVYLLPRVGASGLIFLVGFLFFASFPLGFMILNPAVRQAASGGGGFMFAVFGFVDLIILYFILRYSFSTNQLTLGGHTVRLRRKFLFAKNSELPIGEITSVKKKEFYSRNYQPVHGIEITAGRRRLRFGSTLTEDEKNWLCWEIREFVRQRGAVLEN